MCLRPIRIKNKSKNIDLYHGESLYFEIPCGECAECKKQKQSDYIVRCYYEYYDTIQNGGYVFFETLTYSNDYVPKYSISYSIDDAKDYFEFEKDAINYHGKYFVDDKGNDKRNDFLVFRYNDIRHFFARLRMNLGYAGYDVKDKLKYFAVSEYGGLTHRPHYHLLIFVKDKNLNAKVLKEYIKKSWKLGITDTRDVEKGIVNGIGALQYVAKYVVKDDEYLNVLKPVIYKMQKSLDKRIVDYKLDREKLMKIKDKYILLDERLSKYRRSDKQYSKIKEKIDLLGLNRYEKNWIKDYYQLRMMKPFHKQSDGFGLSLLKYNNYDDLFKKGKVKIPDKKLVSKEYSLPMYITRKMFYNLVKYHDDKDGKDKYRMELNEEGLRYKVSHLDERIDNMVRRYEKFFDREKFKEYSNVVKTYVDDKDSIMHELYILASFEFFEKYRNMIMAYHGIIDDDIKRERDSKGHWIFDNNKVVNIHRKLDVFDLDSFKVRNRVSDGVEKDYLHTHPYDLLYCIYIRFHKEDWLLFWRKMKERGICDFDEFWLSRKWNKYIFKIDKLKNYVVDECIKLLGNRSVIDYCKYLLCYKGRVNFKYDGEFDFLPDYKDMYADSLLKYDGRVLFENHIGDNNDNYRWKKVRSVIMREDLIEYKDLKGNKCKEIIFNPVDYELNEFQKPVWKSIKYKCDYLKDGKVEYTLDELNRHIIDENSYVIFKDFDKITKIINVFNNEYNKLKQNSYNEVVRLKNKFKLLDKRYA